MPFNVWCEASLHDGGWMLALNLDTHDGDVRHYMDDAFWETDVLFGNGSFPFTGDVKTRVFAEAGVTDVLLVAHQQGTVLGAAEYYLLPIRAGQTLLDLFTTATNEQVTGAVQAQTGAVGSLGWSQSAGELFVDQGLPVVINSTYVPGPMGTFGGVNQNFTRLGADYGCPSLAPSWACSSGYVYGGWGGQHWSAHQGGWGARYEGASLNTYCNTRGGYGADGEGWAPPGASLQASGGAWSGCGATANQGIDLTVYVR